MARLHSSLMGLVMLAGCDGPPAPSTILLVTWDTVRADVVGITSAAGCGTPRLDRLAAGGATFTQARSSTPTTLPAHASILTGLHPHRHGARLNGWTAVQADTPSLAEDLQRRGWATAAFISAPVLNANTGLGRGFDVYDDATSFPPGVLDRSAEHSVQEALAWLGGLPADRDALLWVHLYDPHQPWRPPRALVEACEGDLYLAELSYTDAWTGRLFDGLEAQGRLDSAVIAVVADHGEAFGEHGEGSHGYYTYDSTLRVPLVLWAGKATPHPSRGLEIPGPATHVDLAPTLRELVGLEPGALDGRSLLPSLEGGTPVPPRTLPIESLWPHYRVGATPILGVLDEQDRVWLDLPQPELYELDDDPHQLDNRWEASLRHEADALLGRFGERWSPEDPGGRSRTLDDEQLMALGYIEFATEQAPGTRELPDPKDLLPLQLAASNGVEIQGIHPLQVADTLAPLWEAFGPVPALARFLAARLDAVGQYQRGTAVLEEAALAHPEDAELAATIDEREGRRVELEAQAAFLRSLLEEQPDHPHAVYDLAVTLHKLERPLEAAPLYERVLMEHPQDTACRIQLARLRLMEDPEAAVQLLEEAAGEPGAQPPIDCELGSILHWWLERHDQARPRVQACWDSGVPLRPWQAQLLYDRLPHPVPAGVTAAAQRQGVSADAEPDAP